MANFNVSDRLLRNHNCIAEIFIDKQNNVLRNSVYGNKLLFYKIRNGFVFSRFG